MTILLMEAGADLKATVDGGFTPLHLAAVGSGHPLVATALIEAGANVNCRAPDGATPLYGAAWDGNVQCVKGAPSRESRPVID